ncbi:MAG: hypothetical protein FWD57_10380 [Polyangiaceae bacterium]|nr:hypothetical protein [Polyangiaceae bacterium]
MQHSKVSDTHVPGNNRDNHALSPDSEKYAYTGELGDSGIHKSPGEWSKVAGSQFVADIDNLPTYCAKTGCSMLGWLRCSLITLYRITCTCATSQTKCVHADTGGQP